MKAVKITDVKRVGPRTTVGVKIEVPGRPSPVFGRGQSKCRAEDVFSERVGLDLALGRAISDAGQQIVALAEAAVVTEDELTRVLALANERPEILA